MSKHTTPRTFSLCLCVSAVLFHFFVASGANAQDPGIATQRRYAGLNQQILLTVTAPREFGKMTLALMHFDGSLVTEPVEVRPGRVDLSAAMPAIWSLEKAAYLQMLDGEEPIGTALVLQPMLARMVPQVEQAPRPDGTLYSRIVDWRDENAPPPRPPAITSPESPDASPVEPVTVPEVVKPRLMSGLRIEPERDVLMRTSEGAIRLRMRPDAAPNTVNNFLELVDGGFYQGIVFHRVVPLERNGLPFVIQAGDPTATGDGGPGYWLPIEQSDLPHDLGVVSMARADDPDSAGSQFFICLSRAGTARLDGQYCAFGETVEGSDAILKIATTELADASTGRPVSPPVILDAKLVLAPPRTIGKGRPDHPVSDAPTIKTPEPKRVPR